MGLVKAKVPLHVGGILGSTDDSWSKYANFYNVLFKVAFEEINRTDILPNHELVFESKNSKVTLHSVIRDFDKYTSKPENASYWRMHVCNILLSKMFIYNGCYKSLKMHQRLA